MPPGGKGSSCPRATHLKPLGDALGDTDGELSYLGRTAFPFLTVRFIFSLSFHDHLTQETEKQAVSDKPDALRNICPKWISLGLRSSKSPFLQEVAHKQK
jgi:hypothetical protein